MSHQDSLINIWQKQQLLEIHFWLKWKWTCVITSTFILLVSPPYPIKYSIALLFHRVKYSEWRNTEFFSCEVSSSIIHNVALAECLCECHWTTKLKLTFICIVDNQKQTIESRHWHALTFRTWFDQIFFQYFTSIQMKTSENFSRFSLEP